VGNLAEKTRLPGAAVYPIILALIFGIALVLRVTIPYDSVFGQDWVRFGVNDPWYHMRLVENLVHHFPQQITFDPFTWFPYGQDVPFAPFFDLLLGFFIWIIGLGSPSERTIEVVGAYFPAILGALVTIPVYFIGRELFNRNVGLLSAGLIAVLPGEFLFRSLLGFTDHHIAEVLFSTLMALFFILAIKRAREKDISFSHLWSRDYKNIGKPLLYALLTGLVLGMYLLSWIGALLFAFIIAVYIVIQYIIDHLRGKSTDYLAIIGLPPFLIALLMITPFPYPPYPGKGIVIASLVLGMLAFPVLSGLSRLMAYRKLKPAYYPLALVAIGLAGLGVFYAIDPSLFRSMAGQFWIFTPSTAAQTISEVRPLLSAEGILVLVNYFTSGLFLGLVGLGLIIYAGIKERSADKMFLIVWSLIMLAALLSQRRFAYYFAVNVALLSGYICWRVLLWGYLARPKPKREKRKRKAAKGRETSRPIGSYFSARYVLPATVAVIVFVTAFVPNIVQAMNTARDPGGPNEDWHSALVWMRGNTPDPFGDPTFYYEVYERPSAGEHYDYPDSAYGVMSWWDYGHWITRIAHRIPNASPFQAGASDAAAFFTAQDESSASEILDKLGSRYIIIDRLMAMHEMTPEGMIRGKFYAMIVWAQKDQDEFFEVYFQRTEEGKLTPVLVYYPEFYRAMCIRLYNFGGEAVVPANSTLVISYQEKTVSGMHYKQITSAQTFPTYEEALAFLESQESGNYRIVGSNPFTSPVPLEELEHYNLIYKSPNTAVTWGNRTISYVEIFEYSP